MNRSVFDVSQVNDYVRSIISRDPILNRIWVRGEISNLAKPSSGHMYFTLKDEKARIRCVMFRNDNSSIDFLPADGIQVIAKGQVSLYTRDGQYQLYVQHMEPDGVGGLYAAFDALKNKLEDEGLFHEKHKKAIPPFPKKVAVITSHTGAAVKDIINVAHRRNNMLSILVVPVLVQGENASNQISAALDYVNTRDDIEVIIVGRGGGSIEELWAFNEEKVARAIWRSKIPVVSAVGHETDNTIADFVADLRAPTPSAAAELISPNMMVYKEFLDELDKRLLGYLRNIFERKAQKLRTIRGHYVFRYPDRIIQSYGIELDKLNASIARLTQEHVRDKREALKSVSTLLEALSPLKILSRGYSIATNENQEIIKSVAQVIEQDLIDLRLKDGIINCRVISLEKKNRDRGESYD
ncbi:MAG: exodeoxyribonuclease VII large subunit [Clostridiales bacterium]|nr:exodeoxyribonuclease VII large subunit [Clostridiales bacterium]